VRLTRGQGKPGQGGCWMVAVQQYTENKGWHDHPECVEPMIRELCVRLNDRCPDGEREALIGPHLFAPVGTRSDDPSVRERRLRRAVRFALDEAANVLTTAGLDGAFMRAPFGDFAAAAYAAARAAAAAARAAASANAADAAARAAAASANAADAAAYAAEAAASAHAAAYAAAASANAADAAAYAAEAAASAHAAAYAAANRRLLALILDLCAIGERVEVCPVRTTTEVLQSVCLVKGDS